MASILDDIDEPGATCGGCHTGELYIMLKHQDEVNREMMGQTVALNMLIDLCLDKIDDREWVNKIRQQRKGIA